MKNDDLSLLDLYIFTEIEKEETQDSQDVQDNTNVKGGYTLLFLLFLIAELILFLRKMIIKIGEKCLKNLFFGYVKVKK